MMMMNNNLHNFSNLKKHKCPKCESSYHISFERERCLDGLFTIKCSNCGWSYSAKNDSVNSYDDLYDRACYEYEKQHEKSERELLEDILAELKDIKHVLLSTERERY